MSILKFIKIFKRLFNSKSAKIEMDEEIHFARIIIKEKTPETDKIFDKDFIEVIYKAKSYWAIFKCPCGCGSLISLTLQNTHKPYWNLKTSIEKRPTLSPSIWRNNGCFSHFWIKDGMIIWCGNSGIEPWIAEPEYYKSPI